MTTVVKNQIDELKAEIEELSNKLDTKRLSTRDKQIIIDQISDKKREIEKLTKEEKQITPVVNAPTFAERKASRRSTFIGNNRVLL